jgi:hypothetical protein
MPQPARRNTGRSRVCRKASTKKTARTKVYMANKQNVKLKLSNNTRMEAQGERMYSSYSLTTLALNGGEWSASRPGRASAPRERTPGTHWTGGWVGHRASQDTEARGKILFASAGDRTMIALSSSP